MEAMMWLKVVFSVILLGGAGVGFLVVFFGLVDEETRQQQALVQEAIAKAKRAMRKKASVARVKAKKKAWHNRRDELFKLLAQFPDKNSIEHGLISIKLKLHLANKP